MINAPPYVVEDVSQVDSPGILIFRELLESNLDEMIRIAGEAERLCPHCKTHKTREIVQMMLDRGIRSHKCATIAEAEMLASVDVPDVLIAYPLVGPNIGRLFRLIEKFPSTEFTTLVDHPIPLTQLAEGAESAGVELSILVDLESGMGRTGVPPGPTAVELVEMACATPGIRFSGLHWYDGHHRQPDEHERRSGVMEGWNRLLSFRDQLLLTGISVKRLVAGGTGSFPILADALEPGLQLSPGTTTFFDADMSDRFPELKFVPALAILTRVVSCNRSGQATLDVGHKSCAADQPAGRRLSFPALPDAREIAQTEEHCVIATAESRNLRPGDALLAIPRHACPTSAVHQFASIVDGGRITDRWEIVARNRRLTI